MALGTGSAADPHRPCRDEPLRRRARPDLRQPREKAIEPLAGRGVRDDAASRFQPPAGPAGADR
jgi:hypothetical protein